MTILNSGLMFQKKYESDQNAVRRALLANEELTLTDCKRHAGTSRERDAVLGMAKAVQTPAYWQTNAWLDEFAWFALAKPSYAGAMRFDNKRCPVCMEEVFHCHLQSFQWVTRCPLHGVELTDHCPRCGRPWPDYLRFARTDCPTCGTLRPKRLARRRRQFNGHTSAQIATLRLFWSLPRLDRLFGWVVYSDFINHGWDAGILTGSFAFPELAVTFFPDYARLFETVGSPPSRLQELRFDATPLSAAELQSLPVNRPCPLGFTRRAIEEIDREIRLALNGAGAKEANLRLKRHVYVDCIDDYHISEIAYDAWRAIVAESGFGVVPNGWWTRMFELLGVSQPPMPPIVNLVTNHDCTHVVDPCEGFRLWMYKRQLVNLFAYLYRHAALLKALLTNRESMQIDRVRERGEEYWPSRYDMFRVRLLSHNQIQVVCGAAPAWADIFAVPQMELNGEEAAYERGVFFKRIIRNPAARITDTFARYLIARRANNLSDCIEYMAAYETQTPHQGSPRRVSPLRPGGTRCSGSVV